MSVVEPAGPPPLKGRQFVVCPEPSDDVDDVAVADRVAELLDLKVGVREDAPGCLYPPFGDPVLLYAPSLAPASPAIDLLR